MTLQGIQKVFILHFLVFHFTCFFAYGLDINQSPINYWEGEPGDRFTKLISDVKHGETSIEGDSAQDILTNILNLMEVPIESQVLVFAKTSAQISRINPSTPRAIYFSDDCYIGWVQGGAVEIIVYDKDKGGILYLLDIGERGESNEIELNRPQNCLNCHMRSVTKNVPGGIVRSVVPDQQGMPLFQLGTYFVDTSTPIENRWGGWYVTGKLGDQAHMGNEVTYLNAKDQPVVESLFEVHKELESLDRIIRTKPYLHGGQSDIVALMILEHQVKMHNILCHANLMVRQTEHRSREFYKNLGESVPLEPTGTLKKVIEHQAQNIVRELFFVDEAPLEIDGIEGSAEFAAAFMKNRKISSNGRSLKDLRLYRRIFKYRCSYVIYSEVFEFLPANLKAEVYRVMHKSLAPFSGSSLTKHMSLSEKKRIKEILRDTKADLPDYWMD